MAEGTTRDSTKSGADAQNGSGAMNTVMTATQDAADAVRTTAEKAAAKLPDAVASAQEAGRKYINVASNLLNERNGGIAAKGG